MKQSSLTLPEIDFDRIRPWGGSRNGGFEELCVQLFRQQYGELFQVARVEGVGGDGGVEAFWERPNGDLVGLQAKYFRKLGPPQWKQIKRDASSPALDTVGWENIRGLALTPDLRLSVKDITDG